MIQRVKWMRMKSELNLDELYQYFSRVEFNEEDSFGFYGVELNESNLKANYVEKELTHLQFTDPFGDIHEQTLISYNDFSFDFAPLEKGVYLLSVYNPPKSIKKFLDRISFNFNYGLTFSLVNLDISRLISAIVTDDKTSLFKVSRVKVSGLRFSNDSTGYIELVSKGNALDDLANNIKDENFLIDKLKGTFLLNDERLTFEVTKSGLLSTDGDEEAIRFISRMGFL
ncbi:hypothetical protein HVY04_17865 [Citrobacter freundii]|uniref:hypothetical protein n=1 Tax=Citrobacter freundii TaxID=546 RepID=UPI0015EA3E14|nr:hypothetical protein [Citrobacter freundii]QMJ04888.1 hypothetical protein HVY06_17885 [Citrobacter freundii]QMJ13954.1 hypothetical protein HVY04_17865 [Citrobacter freundii]